jgi:hypothetical protein
MIGPLTQTSRTGSIIYHYETREQRDFHTHAATRRIRSKPVLQLRDTTASHFFPVGYFVFACVGGIRTLAPQSGLGGPLFKSHLGMTSHTHTLSI